MQKNTELQNSLDMIGTAAAVNQSDNMGMLQAIALTAAVQPEFPTPMPTDIPTPTMIPTLAPVVEEVDLDTDEPLIERQPAATATPTMSAADARLEQMVGQSVTLTLDDRTQFYTSEALTSQLGTIWTRNRPLTGRLVSYDDRSINIEVPFNIGRSRIATSNDMDVNSQTYIRLYSNVPSETEPVFVTSNVVPLASPATDCTDNAQPFCHGTFSIWLDRTMVESNLN